MQAKHRTRKAEVSEPWQQQMFSQGLGVLAAAGDGVRGGEESSRAQSTPVVGRA